MTLSALQRMNQDPRESILSRLPMEVLSEILLSLDIFSISFLLRGVPELTRRFRVLAESRELYEESLFAGIPGLLCGFPRNGQAFPKKLGFRKKPLVWLLILGEKEVTRAYRGSHRGVDVGINEFCVFDYVKKNCFVGIQLRESTFEVDVAELLKLEMALKKRCADYYVDLTNDLPGRQEVPYRSDPSLRVVKSWSNSLTGAVEALRNSEVLSMERKLTNPCLPHLRSLTLTGLVAVGLVHFRYLQHLIVKFPRVLKENEWCSLQKVVAPELESLVVQYEKEVPYFSGVEVTEHFRFLELYDYRSLSQDRGGVYDYSPQMNLHRDGFEMGFAQFATNLTLSGVPDDILYHIDPVEVVSFIWRRNCLSKVQPKSWLSMIDLQELTIYNSVPNTILPRIDSDFEEVRSIAIVSYAPGLITEKLLTSESLKDVRSLTLCYDLDWSDYPDAVPPPAPFAEMRFAESLERLYLSGFMLEKEDCGCVRGLLSLRSLKLCELEIMDMPFCHRRGHRQRFTLEIPGPLKYLGLSTRPSIVDGRPVFVGPRILHIAHEGPEEYSIYEVDEKLISMKVGAFHAVEIVSGDRQKLSMTADYRHGDHFLWKWRVQFRP